VNGEPKIAKAAKEPSAIPESIAALAVIMTAMMRYAIQ
jgi:hypothetical protein